MNSPRPTVIHQQAAMFNGIFLLFHQTLRRDVRRLRAHWALAAVVVIVCLNLIYAQIFSTFMAIPGLTFFRSMTWLNLILISLCGIGTFATAITEEKEENMLGLLRMAGINVVSLLLGKSTSRMMHIFYLLWIQFPFTLLSVTLGGITVRQIVATYVLLFAYAFFVANLGLLCSVINSRSGAASGLVLLGMVAYFYVVPATRLALQNLSTTSFLAEGSPWANTIADQADRFERVTIPYQLGQIFNFGFKGGLINSSVVFMVAVGSLFFVLAWVSFDWFNREEITSQVRVSLWMRFKRWLMRSDKKRRIDRYGRPWKNAIAWKEYYLSGLHGPGFWTRFLFYAAIIAASMAGQTYSNGRFLIENRLLYDNGVEVSTASVLFVLGIELAFFFCNLFGQEVHSKTWGMFVLIPKTLGRKVWSKIAGGFLRLLPGLFWFTVCFYELNRAQYRLISLLNEEGFWVAVVEVVLFYQLVVYLSLRLKWSVLPVALGLFWGTNLALIPLLSISQRMLSSFLPAEAGTVWLAIYVGGLIAFVLQIVIVQQLTQITEQDC